MNWIISITDPSRTKAPVVVGNLAANSPEQAFERSLALLKKKGYKPSEVIGWGIEGIETDGPKGQFAGVIF